MPSKISLFVGLTAIVSTGFVLLQQQRQIRELSNLVGVQTPSQSPAPSQPQDALVDRIHQLETVVARLSQETYRSSGASGYPRTQLHNDEEDRPFRDDADDTDDTDPEALVIGALESYDPAVRDRIKAVVQEEQVRLAQTRREFRRERLAERTRMQLAELANRVELSSSQVTLITNILDTERDEIMDTFAQARHDFSYGEAREAAKQIRAGTDELIRAEFDDEQFAAYQEMRTEERNNRWGPPPSSPPAEK